MSTSTEVRWWRWWLQVLFAMLGALFLGAGSALAGVGLTVVPNLPGTVMVGGTYNGTVTITNANDDVVNAASANLVTNLRITLACGSAATNPDCPPGSPPSEAAVRLQIVGNVGTGSGSCTTPPGGIVFAQTLNRYDVTSPPIVVGPSDNSGPLPRVCTITFSFTVTSMPAFDSVAIRSGVQTTAHTVADATAVATGDSGGGVGGDTFSFLAVTTNPTPTSCTLNPNVPCMLQDSGQLVGATVLPMATGMVTFQLYDPTNPTCSASGTAPRYTEVGNIATQCTFALLTGYACATTTGFAADRAGVWHWVATYSGDANNASVTSACGAEPVNVSLANPTLQTVPDPASGTAGITALGDLATLQGGFNPTGTITFRLYAPGDTTCSQPPVFTNAVAANGNNQYHTSASFPGASVVSGTYRWTAAYSGDTNNATATSSCQEEPVLISGSTGPHLIVAKTPDNGTYALGNPVSFTIVVTNDGQGIANNVRLSPADALPDPGTPSLNWGPANPAASCTGQSGPAPTCSVTGALGSRVLNCNFGNLAPGGSCSVTVTTPTLPANVTDCVAPPGLQNNVSVIDDEGDSASNGASQSCQQPCDLTVEKSCNEPGGVARASCNVTLDQYDCDESRPIQQLRMQWQGPGTIFIRGTAGVTPFVQGPIAPGTTVTVTGYNGSQGDDVFWNIYDSTNTNQIGQSTFHLSCSDVDMNGAEDCSKAQGNAKGTIGCFPANNNASCVNTWALQGMSGQGEVLDCAHPGGVASITYRYEVTNNAASPVSGVNLVDHVTDSGGTTNVPIAGPFSLNAGETRVFTVPDTIGEDTTDVATADISGSPFCSFSSNQVTVTVTTPAPLVPLFVIGDVEPHGIGDVVNFWGAQWWKNNIMSGSVSNGVASFKGYVARADDFCGGVWEARPGNSSNPPDTIPDEVAIIVTDTVRKQGARISGTIKEIVMVHHDGGYGPAPGHRGNGTVTSVVCTQN